MSNNSVLKDKTGKILDFKIPGYENLKKYSAAETIVGIWKNGKTLYRKIFEFGSFPNNTTILIPHYILNLDEICFYFYSWFDSEDNNWFTGTRVDSSSAFCKVALSPTNVKVEGRGANWSTRTSKGHCEIYYTKTV